MVDRSWELAIRGLHLFGATDFLESIGVVTAGDTDQPVRFGLPPRMFPDGSPRAHQALHNGLSRRDRSVVGPREQRKPA